MIEFILKIIQSIWEVTAEMAAWLLFGFLVAGLLSVFISPRWLEAHLGRRNLASVFKASLFGVPLPLCSCGVIPVAASLRQHGASRAATTAFLLSTPQTGVDSIAITYSMLGPLFAIYRPVVALLTGLLGGSMVQIFDPPEDKSQGMAASDQPTPPATWIGKLKAALDYGLVTLAGDISRALLIGVIIAGVLAAVIPEDFLAGYLGQGPLSIALMMVVGIPLYVCATASVPLAASFIFLGVTPGAALAFLIAGPATNAATLTTVSRVLGKRTALIYLLAVAISAFGSGLALDLIMPWAQQALPQLSGMGHHHHGLGWFEHLSAVVLVIVMTRSWWLARKKSTCGDCCATESAPIDLKGEQPMNDSQMELTVQVEGMNCSHCTGSVDRALRELPGVQDVTVLLDPGSARVTGQTLDRQAIVAAIDGLGFKASLD